MFKLLLLPAVLCAAISAFAFDRDPSWPPSYDDSNKQYKAQQVHKDAQEKERVRKEKQQKELMEARRKAKEMQAQKKELLARRGQSKK